MFDNKFLPRDADAVFCRVDAGKAASESGSHSVVGDLHVCWDEFLDCLRALAKVKWPHSSESGDDVLLSVVRRWIVPFARGDGGSAAVNSLFTRRAHRSLMLWDKQLKRVFAWYVRLRCRNACKGHPVCIAAQARRCPLVCCTACSAHKWDRRYAALEDIDPSHVHWPYVREHGMLISGEAFLLREFGARAGPTGRPTGSSASRRRGSLGGAGSAAEALPWYDGSFVSRLSAVLRNFNVVPTFLSKSEAAGLFKQAESGNDGDERANAATFPAFLEALAEASHHLSLMLLSCRCCEWPGTLASAAFSYRPPMWVSVGLSRSGPRCAGGTGGGLSRGGPHPQHHLARRAQGAAALRRGLPRAAGPTASAGACRSCTPVHACSTRRTVRKWRRARHHSHARRLVA